MMVVEATSEALHQLTLGNLQTVCLVKQKCFAVLVTYDHKTGDFIFARPWLLNRRSNPHRSVSIAEILFQTEPYPYPRVSAS